jgi:hypothetical protein
MPEHVDQRLALDAPGHQPAEVLGKSVTPRSKEMQMVELGDSLLERLASRLSSTDPGRR